MFLQQYASLQCLLHWCCPIQSCPPCLHNCRHKPLISVLLLSNLAQFWSMTTRFAKSRGLDHCSKTQQCKCVEQPWRCSLCVESRRMCSMRVHQLNPLSASLTAAWHSDWQQQTRVLTLDSSDCFPELSLPLTCCCPSSAVA